MEGIFGPLGPSHVLSVADFDRITQTNYRGLWLCARGEITRMLRQEALPTHDGRPGNRGCIVNIASNLALVSRPETRKWTLPKLGLCC